MATYTDINDTRSSLSVSITPADIESAANGLMNDALSAVNTLIYGWPTYDVGYDYVYLEYSDGTEVWIEGSISGSVATATSLYLSNYWSGFNLSADGSVKVNLDTESVTGKLTELHLENDSYGFTYKGSVGVTTNGSFSGSVSSMQFTRTTLDPAVWEAIIFTGSTTIDANGNLTGTITGVEFGYYDVVWTLGVEDPTLTWHSEGKATGLKVSTSSLESMTSYDSLFALNLSGNDKLTGTAGDDYIDASTGNDQIDGLAGNDEIYGGAGNDKLTDLLGNNDLDGGEGNNNIIAGSGDDFIYAGAGNDKIVAGDGMNYIDAGDGNNNITSGSGGSAIYAGAGNDKIVAGDGGNFIEAGYGNNNITTGSGDDMVTVRSGNDKIVAGDGMNVIDAGDGNNNITTGSGIDTIYAGVGNDKVVAGDGVNFIDAGGGNNNITTGSGDDTITAGAGNDKIVAGDGVNVIDAGDGNNMITSGTGDDHIYAGSGKDKITAGAGNDWITSGAGADNISGGLGSDSFVFDNMGAGGFDTISDFSAVDDMLIFDTSVFASLSGGVMAGNLSFGTAAQDLDDYLIFNATGGKLYYDADGSGSGSAVQIAVLKGSVTGLSEANFDVLV